jgi:hypothetical protein
MCTGMHFWARGYFVSTVEADEAVIRAYIQIHLMGEAGFLQDRGIADIDILPKRPICDIVSPPWLPPQRDFIPKPIP